MAEKAECFLFNSENRTRQEITAFYESIFKKVLKPPEWLEDLESPFKWGLNLDRTEMISWNIPDKLCDYHNQGAFYGFEKLGFLLAMLFSRIVCNAEDKILVIEGNRSDESENEEDEDEEDEYEPEKLYVKCRESVDEMASNEGDTMYSRIGPALQHVLQATRAHMLFFNRNLDESQELTRNIQPVEDMSQRCKAGFEGLKAKVVMSVVQNYQIVLAYLHKAMELDPEFGYWPYLVGKVLRRARKECKEGMISEELQYFEKAVSLERNPKFLVFLAQAYQEMEQDMFHSGDPSGSTNNFLQKALDLYRECWRLKNNSAPISRRVGNGMMKIRSECIDKTVAKEALLKAVELSHNSSTYISLGKFYYVHEKNDEKALEQFTKCHPGDFGSSEIIRLNLIKDPNYDPFDILQNWLKFEANTVKQYRSFCDAAWYYLTFKNDLISAAKYIWRVLEKDNKSIRAKTALEYRSYAFCVEGPINLIKVIINEILILREKNMSSSEEQEDMILLENFLQKFLEKYPDLGNINPRPDLIEDLKGNVKRYIANKRRWRYGNDYYRRNEFTRRPEERGRWRNNYRNDGAQDNNRGSYRRQEGDDGDRRYSQWREDDGRSGTSDRPSFGVGDDQRRNRGYCRDSQRRHSESQSNWSSANVRERTSSQSENNRRFDYNNRGRADRPSSSYNSRYDVTITDWRSENRKQ